MRLVIVSNRLPVVLDQDESGWRLSVSSGGLVTAFGPILRRYGGVWIGWPGAVPPESAPAGNLFDELGRREGYEIEPIYLTAQEQAGFYEGFSNQIIWPLFHDLQSWCNFVPEYWTEYRNVLQKFAGVVAGRVSADDFIWVQDYHLLGLGRTLRDAGLRNRSGFFLHTPFPPPDIFCKLPWREEVLTDLLRYEVLGFQTPRDLNNFYDCVRAILPAARRESRGSVHTVERAGRATRVGAFPIGIDYREFADAAASPAVSERIPSLRTRMSDGQIIIAVDRLDYTKGIPYRLKAYQFALRKYPELHRKIMLFQIIVPSRETVPEYQDQKGEIERLVTQVNGEFTQPGWAPIQHVFRNVEREELLALYRVADMALITPLKDGMNLVAKEYCACQVEEDGVLILSEFAGAAVQFRRDAMLVNPYDIAGVAAAIYRGAEMTLQERRPRMRRLRRIVERQDIYWWVEQFLAACGIQVESSAVRRGDGEDRRLDRTSASPAGIAE